VSVVVLPEESRLSTSTLTVIALRVELAFAITVANTGCAPEKEIPVSLALSEGEPRLTGEDRIDEILPGKQATVLISDFALPPLDEGLLLHVEIGPVPTEVRLENNSADYPVRFAID
jgi:hypothetical protein